MSAGGVSAGGVSAGGVSAAVTALVAALDAVRSGSPDLVADAEHQLARHPADQRRALSQLAIRDLLEQAHPDGVDADDLRAVVTRCVRAAASWWPDVDPSAVVVVLTGALGVQEEGLEAARIERHALVVMADLIAVVGTTPQVTLEHAVSEIRREQTIELP